MSTDHVCITNQIPDLRSCVHKARHRSNCDGWGRRYDRETGQTELAYRIAWNPDTRTNDRTLVECSGCLPRIAEVGYLCSAHAAKVRAALGFESGRRFLVDLLTHMWSVESAGVSDGNDRIASAYGSKWPLSTSRVEANEVLRALDLVAFAIASDLDEPQPVIRYVTPRDGFRASTSVDEVAAAVDDLVSFVEHFWERAANHEHTAEALVRLVLVVQTAMARFPLVDTEHRVPYVRCPECGRMSMVWRPPLYHEDEVEIRCDREECGHVADQDWLEHYIATVRTDPRRRSA